MRLMAAAAQWFRAEGIEKVQTVTTETQPGKHHTYEDYGMMPIGVVREGRVETIQYEAERRINRHAASN